MRRPLTCLFAAALIGLAVAGCDKCGHRVTLNTPSLPTSCGDNAEPAAK